MAARDPWDTEGQRKSYEAERRRVRLRNGEFDAQEMGRLFQGIRGTISRIQAQPDGAADQGADLVRELHAALAKVNEQMSDLDVTVHLTPVAIEASALTILTGLVSGFFLHFGCEECPYHERCLALVGFEYNDKACANRLFEWFSHADFPWLYPNRT